MPPQILIPSKLVLPSSTNRAGNAIEGHHSAGYQLAAGDHTVASTACCGLMGARANDGIGFGTNE
jgi:hypothetical protein